MSAVFYHIILFCRPDQCSAQWITSFIYIKSNVETWELFTYNRFGIS